MKRLAAMLLLSSLVAIPLLLHKHARKVRRFYDENIRYDLNEYLAEEGL
ncbi:MAG: hypothetical protein IH628_00695 [Proteobacteria bacterium]|nr:hypothetical protein [Pseudomonadota bacterium]